MAQPPAGGSGGHHWLAAAPPDLRARVLAKIIKNLPRPNGPPDQNHLAQLHAVASRFEARVFEAATSMKDYITTISKKMMQIRNNDQTSAQAASNLQQQAHMGSQMQQANAAQANYSVRPPPMAPAVRSSATHQTQHPASHISSQSSGMCKQQPQPQPQPRLMGTMNQQHLRRVNQMQRVQQANVAVMQTGHPGGQNKNDQQYESPPTSEIITRNNAEEVDWREVLFQKITSLKDAHFAELMEYDRALDVRDITNEQFESMPEQKAESCRKLQKMKRMIRSVLSFLQLQKGNIPEQAMGQLGQCQAMITGLLHFFRMERKRATIAARNCREPPQIASPAGTTAPPTGGMDTQHEHREVPAVETISSQPTQSSPARSTPLALEPNESDTDNLAGEAEDDGQAEMQGEAGAPVAEAATFTGGTCSQEEEQQEDPADETVIPQMSQNVPPGRTCSQEEDQENTEDEPVISELTQNAPPEGTCIQEEKQQEHPADEAVIIPGLTQNVPPGGTTPPAQQQYHSADQAESPNEACVTAEAPVSMDQPPIESGDKAEAFRRLAHELGVNMGRASRLRRNIDCVSYEEDYTSEPESKRQRTQSFGCCYRYINDRVLDEVRDAHRALLETEVSIISDTTGAAAAADGSSTVVGFFYTAVTLPPDFRGAFEVSEVYAKLLVPADYPRSSPAVLPRGELREGFPCSVDAAFQDAVIKLPEPRSIVDMARAFDSCVRSVVVEFVKMIRMWELENYMESRRQYMQNYDPRMGSCICK